MSKDVYMVKVQNMMGKVFINSIVSKVFRGYSAIDRTPYALKGARTV